MFILYALGIIQRKLIGKIIKILLINSRIHNGILTEDDETSKSFNRS